MLGKRNKIYVFWGFCDFFCVMKFNEHRLGCRFIYLLMKCTGKWWWQSMVSWKITIFVLFVNRMKQMPKFANCWSLGRPKWCPQRKKTHVVKEKSRKIWLEKQGGIKTTLKRKKSTNTSSYSSKQIPGICTEAFKLLSKTDELSRSKNWVKQWSVLPGNLLCRFFF